MLTSRPWGKRGFISVSLRHSEPSQPTKNLTVCQRMIRWMDPQDSKVNPFIGNPPCINYRPGGQNLRATAPYTMFTTVN